MVTKEQAQQIYNIYAQIETCDKLLSELESAVQSCKGKVPDIIDESYKTHGSICIEVPYFENGTFIASKGARVFNINYSLAIKVIKSHKRLLQNRLKKINQ